METFVEKAHSFEWKLILYSNRREKQKIQYKLNSLSDTQNTFIVYEPIDFLWVLLPLRRQ